MKLNNFFSSRPVCMEGKIGGLKLFVLQLICERKHHGFRFTKYEQTPQHPQPAYFLPA